MNALVLQAGGPTSVINASLAAVIQDWRAGGRTHHGARHGALYGARFGLQGLVRRDWVDLTHIDAATVDRLKRQPASALGGGRYTMLDGEVERALAHLREHEVAFLFLIGGNGTMAAAQRMAAVAPWLSVIGIPKTVDNDLADTYVSPGYGSAARYLALSVRDAALDLRAMAEFDDVTVFETMGRHAGWLAASTVFAQQDADDGPHITLLPEAPVDEEAMLEAIAHVHARLGICLVVAAEGACDRDGGYLAEKMGSGGADGRGQVVLSMAAGVAAYVGERVRRDLGLRCRQIRPNPLQRSNSTAVSALDRELAWRVGAEAVVAAREGRSGCMMSIRRTVAGWGVEAAPFTQVVGKTRLLPAHMIRADGMGVARDYVAYAEPFLQPLDGGDVLWV